MNIRSACFLICLVALLFPVAAAPLEEENGTFTAVYFTGTGCTHCAKVDPVLFGEWLREYPNFVVIEYEVFQNRDNTRLLADLDARYGTGTGVPILFFSPDSFFIGDSTILGKSPVLLQELDTNHSARTDLLVNFSSVDIGSLPGSPAIWQGDRVLISTGTTSNAPAVKTLFLSGNISAGLQNAGFTRVAPVTVSLTGFDSSFLQAAEGNGWRIQWNADHGMEEEPVTGNQTTTAIGSCTSPSVLTIGEIFTLAAADAVNPCAFAVLSLLLIAVVAQNPKDRRTLLLSGLLFSAAIFLCYIVYGLVILAFLKSLAPISPYRLLAVRVLGAGAFLLGILHLRTYVTARKTPLTAVPVQARPILHRIISGAGSPAGAFLAGAAVTIFLLPCTMGPYIIGCGILSPLDLTAALPYLLLYNLIFILPMVGITFAMYAGVRDGEGVDSWRRFNSGRLHLLAGIILVCMGGALVLGLL